MGNPNTAGDYMASMRHALGGGDPATGVSLLDQLNKSLREVFGFADWAFAKRPPALLDFVAAQDYLTLPADFGLGSLLSVHSIWNPTMFVHKVGLDDLAAMRGLPVQNTLSYYVAVAFAGQTTRLVRPAAPVLEIYPTPQSSITSAIRIVYRGGATDMVGATSVPNIPKEFESALEFIARGKVRMLDNDGDAAGDYRTGIALLQKLQETDGMVEQDAGAITGGARELYAQRRVDARPFSTFPTLHP